MGGGAARILTRKQEFFMSLIYVMLYCAKISKCFHRLLFGVTLTLSAISVSTADVLSISKCSGLLVGLGSVGLVVFGCHFNES